MAKDIYLQIDLNDGKIYEYSKTEKEDFEEYESSTGKKSFRRYLFRGLYGYLVGVNVTEGNFGEQLEVQMKDYDGRLNRLSIPLYYVGGQFQKFADSFVGYMPFLDEGVEIRIYPYVIENDRGSKNTGVSICYAENGEVIEGEEGKATKLTREFIDRDGNVTDGEIPAVIWEHKRGKDVANSEAKDDFLYDTMMENLFGEDAEKAAEKAKKQQQRQPAAAPAPAPAKRTAPPARTAAAPAAPARGTATRPARGSAKQEEPEEKPAAPARGARTGGAAPRAGAAGRTSGRASAPVDNGDDDDLPF